MGCVVLKARGKNKNSDKSIGSLREECVAKHLMMNNKKNNYKTPVTKDMIMGGLQWCTGLVPCIRDKLLGTNPWALETPILSR